MRFYEAVSSELPMDKSSRMARAKMLGFTVPAFHGTGNKFTAFDPEKGIARNHGGGYAPHFTDRKGEAHGYAKERHPRGRVMPVLLRLKNPFSVSYEEGISPALFEKLTGENWDASASIKSPPTSYRALERIKEKYKEGWENPRRMWTNVYQYLKDFGYDGLVFPATPADHIEGHYTKYVVFDPKNIRLVTARFDPAQSDSTDLTS